MEESIVVVVEKIHVLVVVEEVHVSVVSAEQLANVDEEVVMSAEQVLVADEEVVLLAEHVAVADGDATPINTEAATHASTEVSFHTNEAFPRGPSDQFVLTEYADRVT